MPSVLPSVSQLIETIIKSALTDAELQLDTVANEEQIMSLCQQIRPIFLHQPNLLEIEAPVTIVGDIHGQPVVIHHKRVICFWAIMWIVESGVWRGNHECSAISKVYGFYDECNRRYSIRLWQIFQDTFNYLPISGLVGGKIVCMHGGLSPLFVSWDQIRQIERPVYPATVSVLTDFLWSDPDTEVRGWQPNTRGVSYVFGADVVRDFCERMDVDLIARAHQVVQMSYRPLSCS
ncbi:Serine/threonine-protein phosphatase [Aphelenchoides besseyi]|nr:Serine/threonine-protein phosphatase [Aphelenchoides besseyi]